MLIKHKSVYNFKNTLLVKRESLFLLWWAKTFFHRLTDSLGITSAAAACVSVCISEAYEVGQ